jgi:hypothetical protein
VKQFFEFLVESLLFGFLVVIVAPVAIALAQGIIAPTGPWLIGGGAPVTLAAAGGTCAVAGTQTGGLTIGTMTLSGACASTNTVTLGASGTTMPPAPHGWNCVFNDQTTGADANNLHTTSSTTTSVTATWIGAGASSDIISYVCTGY